jgi:hypothetical protein
VTTANRAQESCTAYVFDFTIFLVPQRGFEPLTHALRIRSSFAWSLPINILRTPNTICVDKTRGKTACAGTKVGTAKAQYERTHPSMEDLHALRIRLIPSHAAGIRPTG